MILYSLSPVPLSLSSRSASQVAAGPPGHHFLILRSMFVGDGGDLGISDGLLDGIVRAIAFHCRRLRDAGSLILLGGRVS